MLHSLDVIRELESALAFGRGREVAGLLLEAPGGKQRIHLAPNLGEPGATEVPRWWLDRMLRRRDPSGYRPVAFIHSQMSSLDPSETDRASMRGFPLPWIIVRMEAGQLTWAVVKLRGIAKGAQPSRSSPGTRGQY
jgi:proteasome lid subunit RPN8/RPN11